MSYIDICKKKIVSLQKNFKTNDNMKRFILFTMLATVMVFTGCQKEFTIMVAPNETGMGFTSGSGTYFKGTEIYISAISQNGCEFVKWTDGNTDNPRKITVMNDETYTAVFEKNVFLTIDGVERTIVSARIDQSDFNEDKYDIYIFMSDDEYIDIMADKANHNGNKMDLTKYESNHDGWYWAIMYENNGSTIFDTFGKESNAYPLFSSGTLYVKHTGTSNGKPVFEIRIENGKIKDDESGDGKTHTIGLRYKGELEFGEF